jgi:hypothetical protein
MRVVFLNLKSDWSYLVTLLKRYIVSFTSMVIDFTVEPEDIELIELLN